MANMYEELKKELSSLLTLGNYIYEHTGSSYVFTSHPWTVLKLVFLKLYVPLYTAIIKKYYDNMVYIDLYAGSGLNNYEGYEDAFLPGSPIIAWSYADISFDKMYLVEIDSKRKSKLESRLKLVTSSSERFKVICDDANKAVHDILNEVSKVKSTHYLAFIDPTGIMQVKWPTLQALFGSIERGLRGDVILLFQSRIAARHAGKALKGDIASKKILDDFFGDTNWMNYLKDFRSSSSIEDALINYLIMKIRSVRRNAIIETVYVKLFREIHYLLVFVTHKTKSGNPWLDRVREMKNFIEKSDPSTVDSIIGEILGRKITLHKYL